MADTDRQAVNEPDELTLTLHGSAARSVLLLMATHRLRSKRVPQSPCCCCVRAAHVRAWYGGDSDGN